MVNKSVRVQVSKNNKYIFNESSKNSNDNNSITELLINLKMMQQQVNDFLTTLVETERNLSDKGGVNDSENDIDNDDSEEDDQLNPKKCRLSN